MASAFLNLGDLLTERRQRVHIFTLIFLPSRNTVCLWTLALNKVLVCRLEWLTLLPVIPDFKQISHLMIGCDPFPQKPSAFRFGLNIKIST